jgi:CheY-like chemotaxis protein
MDAPDVNVDPADCREECGEASNIAIVDEEIFARVLIRLLNIFGYSATAFRDAASFLDAFRRAPRRFDCLITDSHLPETTGATGLDLLARVRKLPSGKELRVIVLSGLRAEDSEAWERQIRAAGAYALLYKPFDIHDLVAALHCSSPGSPEATNIQSLKNMPGDAIESPGKRVIPQSVYGTYAARHR